MKIMCIVGAMLCAVCGSSWAQETGNDSNEAYVLQQAREKHAASSQTQTTMTQPAANQTTTTQISSGNTVVIIEVSKDASDTARATKPEGRSYSPFVVSFVPGLSFPFGVYDTSISGASIGALTGSVHGIQGAGVFNIALGKVEGLQGAGVFNISEGLRGVQGAGVFNISTHVTGIQTAGVFNVAEEMHGVQAAGVLNVAGKASGLMLGLVNISDELDGVAIGLVNIIGNGIDDVALDYQFASRMAYATYRSGTPFLYAAFSAGQILDELGSTKEGLSAGFALGHRFRILFLTADIELGTETALDPVSVERLGWALSGYDPFSPGELKSLAGSFATFGTLRASFGFGKRKGFGPYLGIKADFAPSGSALVPHIMRSSFGSALPYTIRLGELNMDIWPKWFVGVKF